LEYTYFELENFRGIQRLRLDLSASPKQRIFTLVGLNESGKTTILEAINHFTQAGHNTETLGPLELPRYAISNLHSLIPIAQRSNFNGVVRCKYGLALDEADVASLTANLKKVRGFKDVTLGNLLEIEQKIVFKDSKHVAAESKVFWVWNRRGRKGKAKLSSVILGDDWVELISSTRKLIPSVLYFPTLLFDFPEKIYLEDSQPPDKKREFYRLVLQDILDATNTGATVTTHIVERAKSVEMSDKRNLDSLLLEMGRHVTKTVFDAWNKTFKTKAQERNIRFKCEKENDGRLYLLLELEDADGQYQLNERSLGFRWFFIFLLLTHYRGFRKGASRNVLFLFDEPASNLHASAQAQLLSSFGTISEKCMIMYTTHSHYMIDAKYLEGTFVIKNEGLHEEEDLNGEYSARKTNITSTKYRTFAVMHPDQTHYYKPVLDVLDYQPGSLENVPNMVMLEGKTDFYVLKYMSEIILKRNRTHHFLPGTGAGNLNCLIQLYLGWGREFRVLLDADKEGAKQKQRYIELFGPTLESRCSTLENVDVAWSGYSLERLFDEDETKFNKTHFHRAIQEALILNREIVVSNFTRQNFEKLFLFLDRELPVKMV
jgi:predicted ATPase